MPFAVGLIVFVLEPIAARLALEIRPSGWLVVIVILFILIGPAPYLLLARYALTGNRRGQIKVSGSTMLKLFRFLLPKTTFERIVQDAVSDMWEQQFEAIKNGEIWRARWIGVRDQMRILLALGMEPVSKVIVSIVAPFIPKR